MIKSYYNPDDQCWWSYQVDDEGNQVGDAEPAPTKKLAERYIKMFISEMAFYSESNAKLIAEKNI
jgi:hypothetical protein